MRMRWLLQRPSQSGEWEARTLRPFPAVVSSPLQCGEQALADDTRHVSGRSVTERPCSVIFSPLAEVCTIMCRAPQCCPQHIEYSLADEVSSAAHGGALPHAAPPSPDYTKQVRTGKTMCSHHPELPTRQPCISVHRLYSWMPAFSIFPVHFCKHCRR